MTKQRFYISYRRGSGEGFAELLREGLISEGRDDIFMDTGKADTEEKRAKLRKEIAACDIFLIALSVNALEDCAEPGDLFRMEIETALGKRKTIVPVTGEEYVWPKKLPASIRSLRELESVPYLQANEEGLLIWPYTFFDRMEAGKNAAGPDRQTAAGPSRTELPKPREHAAKRAEASRTVNREREKKETKPPARPEKKRKSRSRLPVILLAAVLITISLIFIVRQMSAGDAFVGKKTVDSGEAGTNVKWYLYDDGGLSVKGKGSIKDCTWDQSWQKADLPWGDEAQRKITYVIIDKGINRIGANVFRQCKNIKSVSIPSSVEFIGTDAFLGCTGLERFSVDKANPRYCSKDDVLFNKEMTKLLYYPAAKTDVEYTVPEGVVSIENCANADFETIHLPDSLKEIRSSAFSECDHLTSVRLPSGIREIPSYLFWGCDALESVSVPKSVTRISRDVFYLCTNLTNINYEGTKADWSLISIDSDNGRLENVKITYRSY